MKEKKILHIITGLHNGGAEKNLVNLILNENKKYKSFVISLSADSYYDKILKSKLIKVYNINIKNFFLFPFYLNNLVKIILQISPDIIHSWMYHSNFVTIFIKLFFKNTKIIWNLRQSNLKLFKSKILTILISFLCIPFSYIVPNKIICCSDRVLQFHKSIFYSQKKMTIIYNGIDLNKFYFSDFYKTKLQKKLKISKQTIVIGFINRYDNQKNFELFFKFLELLIPNNKNKIIVLMFGQNIENSNIELLNKIRKYNLSDKILLLGSRKNINYYYSLIDYSVSTSDYGEGFSNTLIESIATNTIPIYSNQGDNKKILLNVIDVVNNLKAENYLNLFNKIYYLPEDQKLKIHKLLYKTSKKFTIDIMVNNYFKLYDTI